MSGRIYFDLSVIANTYTGVSIYSWELCQHLMQISDPLQTIPLTCPFRTVGRSIFPRIINAFLRDTLWSSFLIGIEGGNEDYFIFPHPSVPKKFYNRNYAIIIHDLAAWHDPSLITWRGRISLRNLPNSIKNAHRIFAISEYTAQDIAKSFNIPIEKIIVAPNGLSEMYRVANMYDQSFAKGVINGIKLPRRYFLHVGSFEPKKNLTFLLKVYERFREIISISDNPPSLILTGTESWKSSQLVEQIKKSKWSKDIIVLGRVHTQVLPSLYRNAIAFIFPSLFEGFGFPVIESLSQGTPVLINSNSSLAQFEQFGATILNDFNIENWSLKLQAIEQNNTRLDFSSINQVVSYFSWDRTAKIIKESL